MPHTLSEDEINVLAESITDDNFFEKSLALNPEDSDYVNSVKAAQLALSSWQARHTSFMTVSASNGWLFWYCDGHTGRGSTNGVSGSGNFGGNQLIPGHVGRGTFRLRVNGNSISVELSAGFIWRGTGDNGLQGVDVSGAYS